MGEITEIRGTEPIQPCCVESEGVTPRFILMNNKLPLPEK